MSAYRTSKPYPVRYIRDASKLSRTALDTASTARGSLHSRPSQAMSQSNTNTKTPRTASSRPLMKLTVDLLSTYRKINKRKIQEDIEFKKKRSQDISSDSAQEDAKRNKLNNDGYDDENDDYIIRPGEIWMNRFEIIKMLGRGSFGQVVQAYDRQNGEYVGIKIIKNRKSFAAQGQIEIRILEHLNTRDRDDSRCIVKMKEHFIHRNHLCLVYELLSINLYELLKKSRFHGVSLGLIRHFAIQILTCLEFLSRPDVQIIHCDLKPENILLRSPKSPHIKVIDFGSSCFQHERAYSYIQSRFYRSPEVILGLSYTTSIDMWSLGCILYELLSGEPLFAGKNEHDQMCRIADLVGLPPLQLIEKAPIERVKRLFVKVKAQEYRLLPSKNFKARNATLKQLVTSAWTRSNKNLTRMTSETQQEDGTDEAEGEMFLDLLYQLLKIDPSERLTPSEALQHPFLLLTGTGKRKSSSVTQTLSSGTRFSSAGARRGESRDGSVDAGLSLLSLDPSMKIAPAAEKQQNTSSVVTRRRHVMNSTE